MACTLLLPISNKHVTALWFDLIWLASYCITTRTRTLILASYCCPTEAISYCPTNLTSPVPIRIRTDKPRTILPCEPITCYADMPITRIWLGRALLPRYIRLGRASLPRPPNPSLAPYCCRTDKHRADMPATEPDASTVLLPIRTCL